MEYNQKEFFYETSNNYNLYQTKDFYLNEDLQTFTTDFFTITSLNNQILYQSTEFLKTLYYLKTENYKLLKNYYQILNFYEVNSIPNKYFKIKYNKSLTEDQQKLINITINHIIYQTYYYN